MVVSHSVRSSPILKLEWESHREVQAVESFGSLGSDWGCCQLESVGARLVQVTRVIATRSGGARHHVPLGERPRAEQAMVMGSQ